MTNTYKYKSPTEWGLGYKEVKITKKEFKEIFGKNPGIGNKVVVFRRETEEGKKWHCEVYVSKIRIVIALLLYPINVLIEGIANIKSLNKMYSKMFNQREKGTFYTMGERRQRRK